MQGLGLEVGAGVGGHSPQLNPVLQDRSPLGWCPLDRSSLGMKAWKVLYGDTGRKMWLVFAAQGVRSSGFAALDSLGKEALSQALLKNWEAVFIK